MARRMAVPERVRAMRLIDRVDYGDAFAADCPPDVLAHYTPDELGELAMGRAPRWLQLFVRLAHRRMLGLRLTPSRLHRTLGWDLLSGTDDEALYGSTGRLVTVRLLVLKAPGQVVVVFLLRRDRP
ncbi:hypothetical protein [Actinomycetospora termitidis]|uniref:Uncharacterized protein n=1 Tax=Actinomycetospora termitidis TaxID=3053470 RepID=A0ABT7MG29_9PSEU|nr:hypothetical protein [Actinomycetospora sp. Odt1-22]MDL5159638.1 hypothetical protein [Actinomycetospora sp. Odt1-22]